MNYCYPKPLDETTVTTYCEDYNLEEPQLIELPASTEQIRDYTFEYTLSDKGGNEKQDAFSILIDGTYPEYEAVLTDTRGVPVEILSSGDFLAFVAGSKPVSVINATITLSPGNIEVPTELIQTSAGGTYLNTIWMFTIPHGTDDPKFNEKKYDAELRITGTDRFNHTKTTEISFVIDTTPPPEAAITPSFKQYESYGYPLRYYSDDEIYTNQEQLFVSGFTDPKIPPINVLFYVLNGIDMDVDAGTPRASYDQNLNANTTFPETGQVTTSAVNPSSAGLKTVNANGDLTNSQYFKAGNFVQFEHDKTSYGNYMRYYEIQSVSPITITTSRITLKRPLERDVSIGEEIKVFNRQTPYGWFGGYAPLEDGLNIFYIETEDPKRVGTSRKRLSDVQYTIIYDRPEYAPKIIERTPIAGTTNKQNITVSIKLKEPKATVAKLDQESIILSINNKVVKTTIKETSDTNHHYYAVSHNALFDDGVYSVIFTGEDIAGNKLNEDEWEAAWAFEVDTRAPSQPEITIPGATIYNGKYYTKDLTTFNLKFNETNPVTVNSIYVDNIPKDYSCTEILSNEFQCQFSQKLQAITDPEGNPVKDNFNIKIKATKLLDDGSTSPEGSYSYIFVIDNLAPEGSLEYKDYIRPNIELPIKFSAENELNDLTGSVTYRGVQYPLNQISHNDSDYVLSWSIPSFTDKAVETYSDITIVMEDYAGNLKEFSRKLYMDLTPPSIDPSKIDIPEAPIKEAVVEVGNVTLKYTTREIEVTIVGEHDETDLEKIYVTPGDWSWDYFNYTPSKLADLGDKTFTIKLSMEYKPGEVITTPVNLHVEDKAGYVQVQPLKVLEDWEPPRPPTIEIP